MAANDFTFEDLEALAEKGEALVREQDEAALARAELVEVETAATRQKLQLSKQRLKQTQKSNADVLDIINEMSDDHARIDEINNNLLLQIVEPIAGPFNEEYSRKRLAKSLQNDQTRLNILAEKDRLQASEINAQSAVIDSQVATERASTAEELNDVVGIAESIKTELEGRDRIATFRQLVISGAEDEAALDKLAKEGKITKRQAKLEKDIRKDEDFKARKRDHDSLLIEENAKNVAVQNAPIADLKSGEFLKQHPDIPARKVKEELLRDENHQLAIQNLRLLAKQTKRAEELNGKDDAELKELAEKGDQFAELELETRQDKDSARARDKANAKKDLLQTEELYKQKWLNNLKGKDAQKFLKESIAGDGQFLIPGTKTTVTSRELQNKVKLDALVLVEETEIAVGNQLIDKAIGRNVDTISRALGITVVKGAKTTDKLQAIIDSANATAEDKNIAEEILAKKELSPAMTSARDISLMRLKTDTLVNQLKESTRKRVVANKPKAVQQAANEFIQNGFLSNNVDASAVVTTAAIFDEVDRIINPTYKASLDILLAKGKEAGLAASGAGDTENAVQLQQLLGVDDPIDFVAQATLKKTVQEEMAQPIIGTALIQTHIAAANKLGRLDLAEQIKVNKEFQNEQGFDQSLYMKFVTENAGKLGFDVQDYLNAYRGSMDEVIAQLTSTDNPDGLEVAAVNKLLFSNRAVAIIKNRLEVRMVQTQTNAQLSIVGAAGKAISTLLDFAPLPSPATVLDIASMLNPLKPLSVTKDFLTKKRFGATTPEEE